MRAPRNQAPIRLSKGVLVSPGRTALQSILEGCGISLTADQLDSLWHYHQLLRAANARLNLTRIHNFENMVLKHYADSLLVLKFLELPSPLIDMGSGPGLPGIPLAVARPETRLILAEPRGGRAEFLMEVRNELRLNNVEIYAQKVGLDLSRNGLRRNHPRRGYHRQHTAAGSRVPGTGRPDDLHEGTGMRSRDRGCRAKSREVLPACRRSSLSNSWHTA